MSKLQDHLLSNNVYKTTNQLYEHIHQNASYDSQKVTREINKIDRLITQGMLAAEKSVQHNRPPFSKKLHQGRLEFILAHMVLKQVMYKTDRS
ncbi:hypothetical protein TI03_02450 [Achromatium sp. WMS1]|nr:hypothetical protein TI03_02450 [Achromatium sp. WMS1]